MQEMWQELLSCEAEGLFCLRLRKELKAQELFLDEQKGEG